MRSIEFKQDYISPAAGEKLRTRILDARQSGEKVVIDFSGVVIASTSFFDEGFAKLAEHGWSKDMFDSFLELRGLNHLDRKVFDEMCRNRGLK